MYYIKGKVTQENRSDYILIENNNIGYKIYTNENPPLNEETLIYTNVIFNEEEEIIAGFLDEMELETYLVLISINGIGYKTALKILKNINFKKLIYYCLNDYHSELLKITYINLENYLLIASKLKKRFKNVKFELVDKEGKRRDLYKVLRSLGISNSQYEKVSFIENEDISLKEKLSKALKIIYDRWKIWVKS